MTTMNDCAIGELLASFFGTTYAFFQAVVGGEARTIRCVFEARSLDGLGKEIRETVISDANAPEENMAILLAALEQKRWYETKRDSSYAVPRPKPTSPAPPDIVLGEGEDDDLDFQFDFDNEIPVGSVVGGGADGVKK